MNTVYTHMREMGFEVPEDVSERQVSAVTLAQHARDLSPVGHRDMETDGALLPHGGQRAASALVCGLARGLRSITDFITRRRDD